MLLVLSYWLLVARCASGPSSRRASPIPFVPGVRRALRNRPFRILLLTYVVGSVAGAIPGTLMPFFNSYVIRPDNEERWLAIFLGTYFAAGFVSLPLWVALARRFGKRPAWLASFVIGITGGAAMFFLGQGDTIALLVLLAWAGVELRRRAVPRPGDAGRRDRLRRAAHRQAARGAVQRLLGDAAEVRRHPERGDPDRHPRLARLRAQRGAERRRSCWRSRRSSR